MHNTAITKEYVQPRQHEDVEEKITREIHTHDVYHHILPIIETEILPSKNFIESPGGFGVVEIPKDHVHKYTLTGTGTRGYEQPNKAKPIENRTTRKRGSIEASEGRSARSPPKFSDQRTYTTKEGIRRAEYLWRHPPVFEDAIGRTEPVVIPAGLTPEWKGLVAQDNKDKACFSKGRTIDTRVQAKGSNSMANNCPTGPGPQDATETATPIPKPSIPVRVHPHHQSGKSTLGRRPRSGRSIKKSSKLRTSQHVIAKKGSFSNLKVLAGEVFSSEEDLARNNDASHNGGAGSMATHTTGRPSDRDGPSLQLRRETKERVKRKFQRRDQMDIDNE